jgi:hypothetical protein
MRGEREPEALTTSSILDASVVKAMDTMQQFVSNICKNSETDKFIHVFKLHDW